MNSDHAPTAELPPLDEFGCDWEDHAAARIRCYARDKGYCEGTAADALVTELGQREDQLLASLQNAANLKSELAIARDLIADMRARIEELEAERDNLRLQAQVWAGECDTHKSTIQDCYKAVGVTGKCDFNGAEPVREYVIAAEAKLRAIVEGK